jgi:aminoglycoside phosphotransferase
MARVVPNVVVEAGGFLGALALVILGVSKGDANLGVGLLDEITMSIDKFNDRLLAERLFGDSHVGLSSDVKVVLVAGAVSGAGVALTGISHGHLRVVTLLAGV